MEQKELRFDESGKLKVVKGHKVVKKPTLSPLLIFSQASGLGLSISLPMAIGSFIGLWIDKKIGTTPTFTLVLMSLGILIGINNLIQFTKSIQKK